MKVSTFTVLGHGLVADRSIQNDCRQTFILKAITSNYRYRISLLEELPSMTETDLWEFWQISMIADTDCPLKLK